MAEIHHSEEHIVAATERFEDLIRNDEIRQDAEKRGYDFRSVDRLGRICSALGCIESLSLLSRRFLVERDAADDGEKSHVVSRMTEDHLLEAIGLLASTMQNDVYALAREAVVGAQQ